jgi:hypothetical protein
VRLWLLIQDMECFTPLQYKEMETIIMPQILILAIFEEHIENLKKMLDYECYRILHYLHLVKLSIVV